MIDKKESPEGILDLISRIRETSSEILKLELSRNGVEGVVPAHGKILFYLFREKEAIPLSDLVKASGRVKSTITGMVNTLEKHGYLKRSASPADKRSILVKLTPKGYNLFPLFRDISETLLGSIYEGIDLESRDILIETLSHVNSNLKEKLIRNNQEINEK